MKPYSTSRKTRARPQRRGKPLAWDNLTSKAQASIKLTYLHFGSMTRLWMQTVNWQRWSQAGEADWWEYIKS